MISHYVLRSFRDGCCCCTVMSSANRSTSHSDDKKVRLTVSNIMYTMFGFGSASGFDMAAYRRQKSAEYAIRLILCVGSAVSYMINLCMMRYGYNSAYFHLGIDASQFDKALVFVGVSVVIEVMFAVCMHVWFAAHFKFGVFDEFAGSIACFVFMFMQLQHVSVDILIGNIQFHKH